MTPSSLRAVGSEVLRCVTLERPGLGWMTSIEAITRITCDRENFYAEPIPDCWDHEESIFRKEWCETIPREASVS